MFLKRITLQPIYTFSPLYINDSCSLLNLVILAKDCKEEATIIIIEQIIPDDLKSKVFLFSLSYATEMRWMKLSMNREKWRDEW